MTEYIVKVEGQTPDAIYERQLEEIVRCRDCKYYNEKVYKWVNNWTCTKKTCEVFDGCHVESDGFCAWGERRGK